MQLPQCRVSCRVASRPSSQRSCLASERLRSGGPPVGGREPIAALASFTGLECLPWWQNGNLKGPLQAMHGMTRRQGAGPAFVESRARTPAIRLNGRCPGGPSSQLSREGSRGAPSSRAFRVEDPSTRQQRTMKAVGYPEESTELPVTHIEHSQSEIFISRGPEVLPCSPSAGSRPP